MKNTIFNFIFVFGFTAVLAGATSGCGQETVGNTANRERDRDREKANVVAEDYSTIVGTYAGSSNHSDVILSVDVTRVSKEGSTVPSPVLVGSLVFSPQIIMSGSQDRPQIAFPFSDGVYDLVSSDFSFTIEKEARSSQVRCKVVKTVLTNNDKGDDFGGPKKIKSHVLKNEPMAGPTPVAQVKCSWNRRSRNSQFTLTKMSSDDLQKYSNRHQELRGGRYVGCSKVGDIPESLVAEFEAGLVNRPDSMVPEVALTGKFIVTSYPNSQNPENPPTSSPMTFNDGTFDLSTGKVSMTLVGQLGNTPVNCQIESTTRIYCQWLSRQYREIELVKETTSSQVRCPN